MIKFQNCSGPLVSTAKFTVGPREAALHVISSWFLSSSIHHWTEIYSSIIIPKYTDLSHDEINAFAYRNINASLSSS